MGFFRGLRRPGGGIGRRSRLKIYRRKSCGFDPHPGYQLRAGATSFSLNRLAGTRGGKGETQIAGRSRQAIENKKTRPAVYEAFHAAKAALKAGAPTPTADLRRTLAEQIKSLRDTIEAKDRQLDAWAEKWAAVEFNAHKKRIDPDLLLQPLPSFTQ